MKNIKSFLINLPKSIKIIFLSLIILVFLILILLFTPQNIESNHIRIDNFSTITSAPDDYCKYIEETIWNTIKDQQGITENDLKTATIREGSSSEDTNGDIVSTSFLVDIDSLHSSFRVNFLWNKKQSKVPSDPTISVTCPSADEIIYDDFICPIDASIAIKNRLPHEENLKDGTQINLTLEKYTSYQNHAGKSYLSVSLPTCNNYDQLLEAKDLTKSWLDSLHLDYSNLRMEISCSNCSLNSDPTGTDYCHITNDSSENSNLLNLLPYADENFKIEPIDTNRIRIIIFIDRASPDYPDRLEDAKNHYLEEALSWIKSHGFNPEHYPYETTLEYL